MLKDEPVVSKDELDGKGEAFANALHSTHRFFGGRHMSLNRMISSTARQVQQVIRGIIYCQPAEDVIEAQHKVLIKEGKMVEPKDMHYLGYLKVERAALSIDFEALVQSDVSPEMFIYIKSEVEKVSGLLRQCSGCVFILFYRHPTADFCIVVFGTLCSVVQRLAGKKINPIVLAWHVLQWISYIRKKHAPKDDSATSSGADTDSGLSAPNSGKGLKGKKDLPGSAPSSGGSTRKPPQTGGGGKNAGGSGGKGRKASKVRSEAISLRFRRDFILKLQQLINLVLLAICLFLVSQQTDRDPIDMTDAEETKGLDSPRDHSPARQPTSRAAAVVAAGKIHEQLQPSPESEPSASPAPAKTSTSFKVQVDQSVDLLSQSSEYKHLAMLSCSPVFCYQAKQSLSFNFKNNEALKALWIKLGVTNSESEQKALRQAVAAALIKAEDERLQALKANPDIVQSIAEQTAERHSNRCEYDMRTVEPLGLRERHRARIRCALTFFFSSSLCLPLFGS